MPGVVGAAETLPGPCTCASQAMNGDCDKCRVTQTEGPGIEGLSGFSAGRAGSSRGSGVVPSAFDVRCLLWVFVPRTWGKSVVCTTISTCHDAVYHTSALFNVWTGRSLAETWFVVSSGFQLCSV